MRIQYTYRPNRNAKCYGVFNCRVNFFSHFLPRFNTKGIEECTRKKTLHSQVVCTFPRTLIPDTIFSVNVRMAIGPTACLFVCVCWTACHDRAEMRRKNDEYNGRVGHIEDLNWSCARSYCAHAFYFTFFCFCCCCSDHVVGSFGSLLFFFSLALVGFFVLCSYRMLLYFHQSF